MQSLGLTCLANRNLICFEACLDQSARIWYEIAIRHSRFSYVLLRKLCIQRESHSKAKCAESLHPLTWTGCVLSVKLLGFHACRQLPLNATEERQHHLRGRVPTCRRCFEHRAPASDLLVLSCRTTEVQIGILQAALCLRCCGGVLRSRGGSLGTAPSPSDMVNVILAIRGVKLSYSRHFETMGERVVACLSDTSAHTGAGIPLWLGHRYL